MLQLYLVQSGKGDDRKMNKEELKQEAENYSSRFYIEPITRHDIRQAYLASAEPREKRIAELEMENELIKNSDSLCKLIGEQKLQIEKMKCCANCKNYNCLCDCFNEVEQYCDKWELAND